MSSEGQQPRTASFTWSESRSLVREERLLPYHLERKQLLETRQLVEVVRLCLLQDKLQIRTRGLESDGQLW